MDSETQKNRRTPGIPRERHIGSGAAWENQVGKDLKPSVPLFDVVDSFPEVLVIGDGHVNGVHVSCPHLAENCFRPVGILQAIDAMRPAHCVYSGAPTAI